MRAGLQTQLRPSPMGKKKTKKKLGLLLGKMVVVRMTAKRWS